VRRRGLKVLLSEDRGSDLKVRTLYIYDFDDTLVYSPPVEHIRDITKASSIVGKPIKAKPQVRVAYQRAKRDHLGKVIVMTGRINTPELRKAVKNALDQAGYPGHKHGRDLLLKDPKVRRTAEWKKKMLRGLMRRFPNVTSVHMWDDRGEHVEQFRKQIKELGRQDHVVHVAENLYDRIIESYPNRPRGQARDTPVLSKGEKPPPEAPAEEPEQPMDKPLPGNVSPRAFMRGAGTRAQRMRGPRPPR